MRTALPRRASVLGAALVAVLFGCSACGGGGLAATALTASSGSSGSGGSGSAGALSGTANAYTAVYQKLAWASGVTATFSSTCTLVLTMSGVPPTHSDYYLGPLSTAYPTEVAVTPLSGLALSVQPYSASAIVSETITVNACPVAAATTTATALGAIGAMISGELLYNAFEATGTPALGDNVSYSFTTSSGKAETASFIDACNSHATPQPSYTWHYHGVPACLTATTDGTGPSHLIGIALDGFPIYGGRDINGNVISTSQLDACNGITSPTPEFPNGAYHYVLPIGVTSKDSSPNCYAGTVTSAQVAQASAHKVCGLDAMLARLQAQAHKRRRLAALARRAALD